MAIEMPAAAFIALKFDQGICLDDRI